MLQYQCFDAYVTMLSLPLLPHVRSYCCHWHHCSYYVYCCVCSLLSTGDSLLEGGRGL